MAKSIASFSLFRSLRHSHGPITSHRLQQDYRSKESERAYFLWTITSGVP
jgi:hypothetical protein